MANGGGQTWIRNNIKNLPELEYNKDKKEHNKLQPGEIVCLYEKTPGNSRTGTVLMSMTRDPDVLLDIPEGTRALLTRLPEIKDECDEEPVAEIFVDGIAGFVHFSNCVAL